jgi:hypothetical protein
MEDGGTATLCTDGDDDHNQARPDQPDGTPDQDYRKGHHPSALHETTLRTAAVTQLNRVHR